MTTPAPAPSPDPQQAPAPPAGDTDPAEKRYYWEPQDVQWGSKVKRKAGHAEELARQIAGE